MRIGNPQEASGSFGHLADTADALGACADVQDNDAAADEVGGLVCAAWDARVDGLQRRLRSPARGVGRRRSGRSFRPPDGVLEPVGPRDCLEEVGA
jgi:hypothetical protein